MVLVLILILLRQCRYSELNTIRWDSPNAICTIPRITIFPGGIPTIPSHGRFMAAKVAHITQNSTHLADLSQEQACVCTIMEARLLMFCASDASGPHAKPGCEMNSRERHCEDVRLPNLLATSHCFLFRISIV